MIISYQMKVFANIYLHKTLVYCKHLFTLICLRLRLVGNQPNNGLSTNVIFRYLISDTLHLIFAVSQHSPLSTTYVQSVNVSGEERWTKERFISGPS